MLRLQQPQQLLAGGQPAVRRDEWKCSYKTQANRTLMLGNENVFLYFKMLFPRPTAATLGINALSIYSHRSIGASPGQRRCSRASLQPAASNASTAGALTNQTTYHRHRGRAMCGCFCAPKRPNITSRWWRPSDKLNISHRAGACLQHF